MTQRNFFLFGFVAGFFIALGLMVFDEILTLALYCDRAARDGCAYAIPLLANPLSPYQAEYLAWSFILTGVALLVWWEAAKRE